MGFQIENGKLIKYTGEADEIEAVIPNGVTEIGEEAFCDCESLRNIVLPAGVTRIGPKAFYSCSGLDSIALPEGVTEIGENAFAMCGQLLKISIPKSTRSIGAYAFDLWTDEMPTFYLTDMEQYRALRQYLYSDSHLIYINGVLLDEYTYPAETTEIEAYDFNNCASLRRVTIPEGVTTIGEGAFENCINLEYVALPSTLTKVDPHAFSYSIHDKDIYVTDIDRFFRLNSLSSLGFSNYTLWINGEPIEQLSLPDGLTVISENILKGCSGLKRLVIPEGVEKIGDSAFKACTGLRCVSLPSTLLSIGESAFEECSSLEGISLPAALTSIGEQAFDGCGSLKELSIRGNGLIIGQSAFRDCAVLERVVLEEGVAEVDDEAFCMCPALTSVSFPSSITRLGNGVFILDRFSASTNTLNVTVADMPSYFRMRIMNPHYLYCGGELVESYAFPAGTERIEDNAFICCISLKRVIMPDSVKVIGANAFFKCLNLEEAAVPKGVTLIRGGAFSNCESIKEVVVPESVRSIGANAFAGCTNMKTMIVKGKDTHIADSAFMGCKFDCFSAPEDEILESKRAGMWLIGMKFYPGERLLLHLRNCPKNLRADAETKILECGDPAVINVYLEMKKSGAFDRTPTPWDALRSNRYSEEELENYAMESQVK